MQPLLRLWPAFRPFLRLRLLLRLPLLLFCFLLARLPLLLRRLLLALQQLLLFRLLSRAPPAMLPVLVQLPVLVLLLLPRRAFRAPWSPPCLFVLWRRRRVLLALLALRACQMIAPSLRSLCANLACASHARAAAVLLPLLLRPPRQ
jgi:hypothetical protein